MTSEPGSEPPAAGLLDRLRRRPGWPGNGGRPGAWLAGRELRRLLKEREAGVRDLGGLALEMVRRDRLRPDLLARSARGVLELEDRIREVEAQREEASRRARGERPDACACGAPVRLGARFCPSCGRPYAGVLPLSECRLCGRPLAADSNFCPYCGNAIAAEQLGRSHGS